jgi:ABC-type sugar transport system substrate-binding protein
MQRYKSAALIVAIGLLVAACGNSNQAANGPKPVTVGFVTHVIGDTFVQSIARAAKDAGTDLGATVKVTGPAGFDPVAQLKMVQDIVASGADGVSTSIPGDSMANGLNEIVANGKPVVQFNLMSKLVKGPYVGERSTASGRLLASKIVDKLGGTSATGTVIIGICAPGLGVLENRARGVKQGLSVASGLTVIGPLNVGVDPAANFTAWEQARAAHPDVKAMIGLCAPDVANLGKLNADHGDKIIAGGYDETPQNLAAIKQGHALVTLGQSPYIQGYLPIKMIVDAIRNGTKVPQGFIDSGEEVVTADNVDAITAREGDPAKVRAYYKHLLDTRFKDPSVIIEPIENEGL